MYVQARFIDVILILAGVSKKAGSATTVDAEERTQKWYFAFSVVQIFLITTFSSGAAAVATQIAENPKIIPQLLADNLPKASNFYLSYFIIQGTASAAQNIINYSDVYEYIFYDKVMDKTPRQKYDRLAFMRGVSWGSVYPKFANLTVIGKYALHLCETSLTRCSNSILLYRSADARICYHWVLLVLSQLSIQPLLH